MVKTTRRLQSKPHTLAFESVVNKAKLEKKIHEIDVKTLKKKLDDHATDVILIDVREQDERAQFYIEGSIHISRGVLERDIEKIIDIVAASNKYIITVCSGGYRSILAAASLIDMGYQKVSSLEGGLRNYLEQNYDNIVETNPVYLAEINI